MSTSGIDARNRAGNRGQVQGKQVMRKADEEKAADGKGVDGEDKEAVIRCDFDKCDPDNISILIIDDDVRSQIEEFGIKVEGSVWLYDAEVDQRARGTLKAREDGSEYLHCHLATMEFVAVSGKGSRNPLDASDVAILDVISRYADIVAREFKYLLGDLSSSEEVERLSKTRRESVIQDARDRIKEIEASAISDFAKARRKMHFIEAMIIYNHNSESRKCEPVGEGDVINGCLVKTYIIKDEESQYNERFSIEL